MKSVRKNSFVVSIFLLFAAMIADLSVDENIFLSYVKQVMYVFCTMLLLLNLRTLRINGRSFFPIFGLLFFILSLTSFTLIEVYNLTDLYILVGYYFAFFTFVGFCLAKKDVQFNLFFALGFILKLFVLLQIAFLFNYSDYSTFKGQFYGSLTNPNSLAGLVGLSSVFFACRVFDSDCNSNLTDKFFLTFSVLILFLTIGRGAILSAFIAIFFIFLKLNKKMLMSIAIVFFIAVFFYLIFNYVSLETSGVRNILESTRSRVFERFFYLISENDYFFGVGVSELGGRYKGEMSYLDAWTMSGLGIFGFIIFIVYFIFYHLRAKGNMHLLPKALFVYVLTVSIFEAYASNTMSIISYLFYAIPGILINQEIK